LTRPQRGRVRAEIGEGVVRLFYAGLDHLTRQTEIRFDPRPTALTENSASFRLDLMPQGSASFYATVCCDPEGIERTPFLRVMRQTHREMKQLMKGDTKIATSNHRFNEMLRRSTVDLAMLSTDTPQGLFPYAGIPWYSTTFGRDGLITALQCLWLDRRLALAVLKRLAALQATDFDAASDAAPGKILHEMRSGEMANLREIPFGLITAASMQRRCSLYWLVNMPSRAATSDSERALARHGEGTCLGRRSWRCGSRWLHRVLQRVREGTREPRLEGLSRRLSSMPMVAGGRTDRARGGARICLCGEEARRLVRGEARIGSSGLAS
jgi:hypothetical protein